MRIAFIIHSKSTKARNSFTEISSQITHEHVAFHTTGIGSAHEIALRCSKEGYTHLAVLGGDGTLNEVLNGLSIAPHADVSDGVLNCVILGRVNLWDYMLNLHSNIRCRPIQHKEIHYRAANEIEIKWERSPLELDGEHVGFSPASIRVIPRAIRLLIG